MLVKGGPRQKFHDNRIRGVEEEGGGSKCVRGIKSVHIRLFPNFKGMRQRLPIHIWCLKIPLPSITVITQIKTITAELTLRHCTRPTSMYIYIYIYAYIYQWVVYRQYILIYMLYPYTQLAKVQLGQSWSKLGAILGQCWDNGHQSQCLSMVYSVDLMPFNVLLALNASI